MDFDPNIDYYKALGVSKGASQDEIKKAFREKAKEFHPDRQSGKSEQEKKAAEAKFKEVNDAYEVLGDEEKRRHYDRFREMGGMGGFGRMGGFGPMGGMGGMGGFSRMHRGFGSMGGFDPFGDGESEYTTVKPKPSVRPERGQVAKAAISISFEDSVYGVKDFPFRAEVLRECPDCGGGGGESDWEMCGHCGGTGWTKSVRGMLTQITNCRHCGGLGWLRKGNCGRCGGSGVVAEVHDFTVSVPRGATSGTLLRLAGVGHAGPFGGERNDLIVMVQVRDSDRFAVGDDGLSLYTVHRISPVTAILGNEKEEVVTPWGICEVNVPSGCSDGTKLRLKGQGIPNRHDGGRTCGDLYVILSIEVPKVVDEKDLKKVEAFRKWYEGSSLNTEINGDRQSDKRYMDEIKAKYDISKN